MSKTINNSKTIFTNEVDLSSGVFNFTNIDRDFDIFEIIFMSIKDDEGKLQTSKKYISARMFDFIDMEYKALAVLYSYGTRMYCLFTSGMISPKELKEKIEEVTCSEVTVNIIEPRDTRQIKPHHLAQLLCNSLYSMEEDNKCHNLMGKLFYYIDKSFKGKKEINKVVPAKISFTEYRKNKYILECSAVSFHTIDLLLQYTHKQEDKNKILNAPKYILSENGLLKKKMGSDTEYTHKNIFVQKGLGSPNTITFTDFSNLEGFYNSKAGVYYMFMKDVEDFLNDYLTLSFKEEKNVKTFKNSANNLLFQHEKDYFAAINQKGINLINYAADDFFSITIFEQIKINMKALGITNIMESDIIVENHYNLVILHTPEYYEYKHENDPYFADYNIQHLMIENCISSKTGEVRDMKSIARKCLYELMLKKDLKEKTLTLYTEEFESPITYVKIENKKNEEGNKIPVFHCLTIDEQHQFDYKFVDSGDQSGCYEKLMESINYFKKDHSRTFDLKYIIYNNTDTVLLADHGINTMPDLYAAYERLNGYSKDKTINKDELIDILKSYKQEYTQYEQRINELIRMLETSDKKEYSYEEVTNNQKSNKSNRVEPLIPLSGPMGQSFVDYSREKYNFIFNPVLKNKSSDSIIKNQMTKINTYANDIDYRDKGIRYYVGSKQALNGSKFEKGIRVKTLIPVNRNNQLINKIISQLDVDFVRLGEYTVYPFPIKYLNEYIKCFDYAAQKKR